MSDKDDYAPPCKTQQKVVWNKKRLKDKRLLRLFGSKANFSEVKK